MNGRIDRDYKFEKHTIRGLEKMEMFMTVTFLVSLTLAKAKIGEGKLILLDKYLTNHIKMLYLLKHKSNDEDSTCFLNVSESRGR